VAAALVEVVRGVTVGLAGLARGTRMVQALSTISSCRVANA
jgi:hypothetical protein